jgi:hypothetical protein
MILTLGVSLIFQSVALAWFGAVPRQNQTPISDQAWTMRPIPGDRRRSVRQQRTRGAHASLRWHWSR